MRGENTTVLIIGDTTETKGFMHAMLVVTISAGSSALLFFLSFISAFFRRYSAVIAHSKKIAMANRVYQNIRS